MSESRGKRRRLVSSESTGGVGASDAGLIPGLPPALALSMLSHLLAGGSGNAATTMARDELMADNGSSVSLEVWIVLVGVTGSPLSWVKVYGVLVHVQLPCSLFVFQWNTRRRHTSKLFCV